ncbi:MAG TPA: hypothetical protein VMV45_07365 [Casimicrobiaceae bacterium]|nr:hypothetical protein [Casimicrobiaceae bacterium]
MTAFTHRYVLGAALYDAGLRVLRRRLWPRVAFVVAALLLIAILGNFAQDPMILAIALTALFIVGAVVTMAVMRMQSRRQAMLTRFGGHSAEVTIDDQGVRIVLPEQEGFRRWSLLRQLWCGKDVWILSWHGASDPVLLPAAIFAGEAGAFTRAKATEAGARVRDV